MHYETFVDKLLKKITVKILEKFLNMKKTTIFFYEQ